MRAAPETLVQLQINVAHVKVSVITVVRNAAPHLAATLQSVSHQTETDVEHVLVDGASTDDTLAVASQHGQHLARIVSEPDSGIYDAFNKGLKLVTGDVIAFLNAGDTYADHGVLSRVATQFASQDVDAVYGDVLIVDVANQSRVVRHYRSDIFRPERLAYGFMPAHPALFVKRNVFDRLGGFDTSFRQAGDFEFCVRAFMVQRIRHAYMAESLVRMLNGGVSNRGLRSKLINTREMRRACLQNGLPTNYLKLSLRLPIKAIELLRR